jgi:hypothetical protein
MHFITTLITINSTEEILKYLTREPTFLKKRIEKPLSAIENSDSLVLEMETEMEFISSGGNYLPALDDNFLADQVVMVPIVRCPMFHNDYLSGADCVDVLRLEVSKHRALTWGLISVLYVRSTSSTLKMGLSSRSVFTGISHAF